MTIDFTKLPDAKTAFEESIRNWEDKCDSNCMDDPCHFEECALCDYDTSINPNDSVCENCPLKHNGGDCLCAGTPHSKTIKAFRSWVDTPKNGIVYRRAAREMTTFLKKSFKLTFGVDYEREDK